MHLTFRLKTTDDPDQTGGESGTIQNIKGNSLIGQSYFDGWYNMGTEANPQTPRCVGSVADEKNDRGYFLFASPLHPPKWDDTIGELRRAYIDTIIEQGLNGQVKPVVIDIFGVVDLISNVTAEGNDFSTSFSTIKTLDASMYKPGMEIRFVDGDGVNVLSEGPLKIRAIDNNTILLHQKMYNTFRW